MDSLPEQTRSNSGILAAYRARTRGSAALAREAAALFPSGITHDSRQLDPYGIYVARAQGPHKWDVDGNRYIDYFGGHGALLLGHNNPAVAAAIQQALADGTQFGANHPREIAWARAIQRLVPSAERVRFTSSGTEATLMAVRLARAFTGRQTLLRFQGHFHGWHDHMTSGYSNHYDGSPTPGVLPGVAEKSVLVPPNDLGAVRAALAGNRDIAAVILEPTGSSFGQVPIGGDFVRALRQITEERDVLLILDEVITGFRVAPGGAQAAFGVRPDLSAFAKIVAGGLPGAAVAGRADILCLLDFAVMAQRGQEKVAHQGTFNANPVSAAAGIAALGIIADTDACDRASAAAARLRDAWNEVLDAEQVPWAAYGTFSGFHMFFNPRGRAVQPLRFDASGVGMEELKAQPKALVNKLRLALLVNGVDVGGRIGGFLSCTHTADDVAHTAEALRGSIRMLRQDGELSG
ncbi:MAG TPA: aminotransferase class III-fold pyridoxal phosphate-dependent enzyme [Acetobacteraceae bacterium]|nr:aminotransferase class III-fold pyridoxal phosphate-dependent enzyme [Acetobacteraceae bacterium]